MLIFNTTFHVEDSVADAYLAFMKETYIPAAIDSGLLCDPRFCRIHAQHEENGESYSLQFRTGNNDTLNRWFAAEGQFLQQELMLRFGNKVLSFVTLMDEIELL